MNNNYVYIFLDPRKEGIWYYKDNVFFNQPFYVGEGKGKRFNAHFSSKNRSKNSLKNNIINKIYEEDLLPIIKILYTNLTKSKSLEIESDIIKTFGRVYSKDGILSNIFKYGNRFEYNDDYIYNNENAIKKAADIKRGKTLEEIYGKERANSLKKKVSEIMSKKFLNGEIKPFWEGKKMPTEVTTKISNSLFGNKYRLGIKHTEEDKLKMSLAISKAKGRPVKSTNNDGKILYFQSVNSCAVFYNISAQMLDEAFKNKNFCNSKKAKCKIEIVSREEYNENIASNPLLNKNIS